MNLLDLFSGIGGFSLAAHWLGWSTVGFVEKDDFCQKVLRKNFGSDIPIYDDIKQFSGKPFRGRCHVISGGFPCQPFSQAGKQKGADDDRHLFPEMLRVISEVKPRWVVAENVRGLLSIGDGDVFESVCTSLESEGYEVQSFIVPASAVNAPHRRDRVWVVANSGGGGLNSGEQSRCADSDRAGTRNQFNWSNHVGTSANSNTEREQQPQGFEQNERRRISDSIKSVSSDSDERLHQSLSQQGQRGFRQEDSAIFNRDAADTISQRLQGSEQRQSLIERAGTSRSIAERFENENWVQAAAEFCRVDARVPFELDVIRRGVGYEQSLFEKSNATRSFSEWSILRYVWENRKLAAASPELYKHGLLNCVPELPQGNSYEGWLLGERLESYEGLCDLWQAFYAQPFEKAQNMQRALLERIRQIERSKKMEQRQRVNRLRALGNAIVPQVAFEIFKAIDLAEKENEVLA